MLLVNHERPRAPTNGTPAELVRHATEYGAYCRKIELQNQGWKLWIKEKP